MVMHVRSAPTSVYCRWELLSSHPYVILMSTLYAVLRGFPCQTKHSNLGQAVVAETSEDDRYQPDRL
jgi:hypothetical protein